MSEWFKEPVLKTGDSQEPWVRIPPSPPIKFVFRFCPMEKYPRGRRGSPAKGVDGLNRARVQIPPSPPKKNRVTVRVVLIKKLEIKILLAGPQGTSDGKRGFIPLWMEPLCYFWIAGRH